MRTAAVLPVKSFGRAKQRLGDAVPDRARLAEAMLGDVLSVLAATPALDDVVVVTAEPAAASAARSPGVSTSSASEGSSATRTATPAARP